MSFLKSIFPQFIGTVFGFLFSLFLFYLTNLQTQKNKRLNLERYFKKELEYNKVALLSLVGDIDRAITAVTADNHQSIIGLKFSCCEVEIFMQYFREGFLYERMSPKDLHKLSKVLPFMQSSMDKYVHDNIQRWKVGELDKISMLQILNDSKFQVNDLFEHIEKLLAELK